MGVFKKIFGGSEEAKEEKVLPWQVLKTIDQLDTIANRSKEKVQVIFKHSTRCGISKMVMNRFVSNYDFENDQVDLYYLDLLNYREVSNEVGYKFQVLHQSPQMIIIKNGETIHHSSHHSIDVDAIQAAL